jgi:hypothetical protein
MATNLLPGRMSSRRVIESDDEDNEQQQIAVQKLPSKSIDEALFGSDADEEEPPASTSRRGIEDDLFGEDEDDDQVEIPAVIKEEEVHDGADDADLFGDEDDAAEYPDYGEEATEEKPLVSVNALLPDTQGPKDSPNVLIGAKS